MNDPIETFYDLFRGRTDAYGTWDGGCNRSPLHIEGFKRHLYGEELIGVYPLTDESTVRWGCSDIDVDDYDSAHNLSVAFKVKGVPSFIEKTRRGYHIWVFANDWVPAPVMRRAFLAAHEAVQVPAKEVNPKQEECIGLGNYVRLPYPGGMNGIPENRFMLDLNEQPVALSVFLDDALTKRVTQHQLAPLAQLWRPRQREEITNIVPVDVQDALALAGPYITKIWRNGPQFGNDRSNLLCMLTHRMKERNLEPSHAWSILKNADKRWGKFHLRENGEIHLMKIFQDIYGEIK